MDSSHIILNNKKISRVNIVATVIQKFENEELTYANITVDDGSSDIRIKAWAADIDLISNLKVGDLILVVGRIKQYNDEIYIVPEIVKKVHPNWELVHKSILLQEPKQEYKKEVVPNVVEEIKFNDNI